MNAGRFAPSPTSQLHLGNLRTAVLAWCLAKQSGADFILRIEDLDQTRVRAAGDIARQQIADLAALGIISDKPIWRQSERTEIYQNLLSKLPTYECFCTRKEIAQSAQAPNGYDGFRAYSGRCKHLSTPQKNELRQTRPPALRVDAQNAEMTVFDCWAGPVRATVDDFVLRRNDGTFAYNYAAVVDDGLSGVTQVCRGDDLLSSSPRQAWLAQQLGFTVPQYAHVGLVLNQNGKRLAKRDGAIDMHSLGGVEPTWKAILQTLTVNLQSHAKQVDQINDLAHLLQALDLTIKPETVTFQS